MEIKFVAKQHWPKFVLLENSLFVAKQHYLIGCAQGNTEVFSARYKTAQLFQIITHAY